MSEYRPDTYRQAALQYRVTAATHFDLGLIVEDAVRLLRAGSGQFLLIILVLHVPLSIAQILSMPADLEVSVGWNAVARILLLTLVFALLNIFVTTNMYTAAAYQMSEGGRPFYVVFTDSVIKYPSVVIASVIYAVVIAAGTMALIIPGIVFAVYGTLFLPAMILRGKGIIASLITSYEMVKGSWWWVLLIHVILILVTLLVWLALLLLDLILQPGAAFEVVASCVFGVLTLVSSLIWIMTFLNLESIRRCQEPPSSGV
jgi:hypothetical protein